MRHRIMTGFLILIIIVSVLSIPDEEKVEADGSTDAVVASETAEGEEALEEETSAEKEENMEEVEKVPGEYTAALKKAKTYASVMHMSKVSVYDQLTSEYGEKFTPEQAQYAINNVVADWKNNALSKARTYANEMNMSDSSV